MSLSVIHGNKIIYKKINRKDKIDNETIFHIASITKAFIAVSIGILVDQNKLNFDDKVKKYIPELK
jgi:CubicO group peptidase (beta-lactamase class C family)